MKYIVLLGDGMSDHILPGLENKTPLEVAKTPNMDFLAKEGRTGRAKTVPNGFKPGSDIANLAILGYDVRECYSGRAPLEAASADIQLGPTDVAYRCNLVTLDGDIMDDYSAGHITTEEAHKIIETLQENLGTDKITFYKGISYRHLLVIKDGPNNIETTPPHDLTGEVITGDGPEGEGSEILAQLMEKSQELLENHPVNIKRKKENKKPVSIIWLWGQGKKPQMQSFRDKFDKSGTMITAVDLLKGIGKIIGLQVPDIPGATGYLDTNYANKVKYTLNALKTDDFVYVHVEAPDEAGHSGKVAHKIQAIEDFDKNIVGPIMEGLKEFGDYKVLLLPDHATPISTMTHSPDPVPFVLYDPNSEQKDEITSYNEIAISKSDWYVDNGYQLIEELFK